MFQFNRSQQNHFCTSMLQLFLMKVGRNASTCCQHPQFLIESVDHRLVTISRFMLTLILQTASNLRLAAIISLQYAYLDQGGRGGEQLSRGKHNPHNAQIFSMGMQTVFRLFIFSRKKENPQSGLHTYISLSHAIHMTGFSRNPLTTVVYNIYSQNVNKC